MNKKKLSKLVNNFSYNVAFDNSCADISIINNALLFVKSKWSTGRKVLRTQIVYDLLEDEYLRQNLNKSISLDILVNMLDDLVDDSMSKDEVVMSVLNLGLSMMDLFGEIYLREYVRKLIELFLCENVIKIKIRESVSDCDLLKNLSLFYRKRAMDIDAFVRLGGGEDIYNHYLNTFRNIRSLTLIYKDILDSKHDLRNKTFNAYNYLSQMGKIGILSELLDDFVVIEEFFIKRAELVYKKYRNAILSLLS